MLDLLGIANSEVAKSPLRPMTPGNVLHRRRDPSTIDRHRPEYIAFFNSEVPRPKDLDVSSLPQIQKFVQEHSYFPFLVDVLYFRAGPLAHLFELGYRSLTVIQGDYVFHYFVSSEEFPRHLAALEKLGAKTLGAISFEAEPSAAIRARFPN